MSGYEMISREFIDKTTMVSYVSQFYELFRKESVERDAGDECSLLLSLLSTALGVICCCYSLYPLLPFTITSHLIGFRFSAAVTCWTDQRSYSTLGPVSDRLWTGKPPQRRTKLPCLRSLSHPFVVRLEWVPGKSWDSKQAYRVIH